MTDWESDELLAVRLRFPCWVIGCGVDEEGVVLRKGAALWIAWEDDSGLFDPHYYEPGRILVKDSLDQIVEAILKADGGWDYHAAAARAREWLERKAAAKIAERVAESEA